MALVFVGAFALAFAPHGQFKAEMPVPEPSADAISPRGAALAARPKDAPGSGDWGAYGRSNAARRYSPLAQVTADNVADLERAWTYRTGDLPDHNWGDEITPLQRQEEQTSEL